MKYVLRYRYLVLAVLIVAAMFAMTSVGGSCDAGAPFPCP